MAQKKLILHNQRMLNVIDYLVANQVLGIKSAADFFREIGNISRMTNSTKLKNGLSSFTIKDIASCIRIFKVDANYIFAEKHTIMFRAGVKTTPFQQLLEAVQRIGTEMNAMDEPDEESEAVKLARTVAKIEAEEKRKKDNYEYI